LIPTYKLECKPYNILKSKHVLVSTCMQSFRSRLKFHLHICSTLKKVYTFIVIFFRYLLYLKITHHYKHTAVLFFISLTWFGYVRVCEQGEITMNIKTKCLLNFQYQSKMVTIRVQNIIFKKITLFANIISRKIIY